MKPIIQPGMHPDAEILTAFAEQLVSETEREEILAHMAVCGRCREVVFFAQKAAEADQPAEKVREISDEHTRSGWFLNWRWAWIPVAALAGVVGFAVIEHSRHAAAPTTQMAQNAPLSEPPLSTAAKQADEAPQTPSQPIRVQPSPEEVKQKSAAPLRSDRDAEVGERSLDQKDVAVVEKKKEDSATVIEPLGSSSSGLSGGAVHGSFAARAKSSAIGGPTAQNQMQAQNSNAQLQQQNNAQLQQLNANEARQADKLSDSANKPAPPSQPATATQTVTAQAETAIVPASPAPAAAPAVRAMTTQIESVEVSGRTLAKLKGPTASLPSKLGVLSEVSAGRTMIAIDTAGAVYQSEDAGKHWQAVDAPWSGRAVLVKTRPAALATGGLLKQSTPRFELTTDKLETWTSADGKTWMMQTSSPK